MKLGEVVEQDKTTLKPSDELCSRLPYVSLEHVEAGTGRINVLGKSNVLSNTFIFDDRHVLYGKLRPYLNKVATPDFRGRCTTEIIPLIPEGITREYLAHFLRLPETVEYAMTRKTGSRMPRTDMRAFVHLPIPLPPLAEQQRIVRILDEKLATIEKAKRAAEVQLEAANALPEAYLRQVIPENDQELPTGWRLLPLREVCERVSNINPKNEPEREFVYVDISAIDRATKEITQPKSIKGSEAPSRARRRIKSGDVLVSTTRPNLNAVALVTPEFDDQICSTGICVLRPKPLLISGYLFWTTRSSWFVSKLSRDVNGAMYPAVTDKQILDVEIPLPPIAEQIRIDTEMAVKSDSCDSLLAETQGQLETVESFPSAILRSAITGEMS